MYDLLSSFKEPAHHTPLPVVSCICMAALCVVTGMQDAQHICNGNCSLQTCCVPAAGEATAWKCVLFAPR